MFGRGEGGGKGPLFHPPLVCTPVGWSVERRREGTDVGGGIESVWRVLPEGGGRRWEEEESC